MNGRARPAAPPGPIRPPSRLTPALIRRSSNIASAAVVPPREWPNMPTVGSFRAPHSPSGSGRCSASGLLPALRAISVSRTKWVSATRTATGCATASGELGGSAETSTRPSGNSTGLESWVWSMVATTYPRLTSSSTKTVLLSRVFQARTPRGCSACPHPSPLAGPDGLPPGVGHGGDCSTGDECELLVAEPAVVVPCAVGLHSLELVHRNESGLAGAVAVGDREFVDPRVLRATLDIATGEDPWTSALATANRTGDVLVGLVDPQSVLVAILVLNAFAVCKSHDSLLLSRHDNVSEALSGCYPCASPSDIAAPTRSQWARRLPYKPARSTSLLAVTYSRMRPVALMTKF